MAEILLSGIKKRFGAVEVLPNLDLAIERGQFVTLLGPSGCGKTTTLRIIAGLEDPDEGELSLFGRKAFSRREGIQVPPERRGLGFIFQSYALWPHLKVERNVSLALREAGLPKDEIAERLALALEQVQLTGLADRYPSELSGGQQQRVAVARVIAAKTAVFLMDEPLSNLDAALRGEMRAELKRLHRDQGATTVYVTHDQIEALTMSDVIVVMKDGSIQQMGSPYEVYHHPANLFVAEFIGDPRINCLDARLRSSGGALALEADGCTVALPSPLSATPDRVVLAVRPEAIDLSVAPRENAIEARVESVQPMGAQTIVHARSGQNPYTVLMAGFAHLDVGSQIWLRIPGDKVVCFDTADGRNLSRPESSSPESTSAPHSIDGRSNEPSTNRRAV